MTNIIFAFLLLTLSMEIHGAIHGKIYDTVIERKIYSMNTDEKHKEYDKIVGKQRKVANALDDVQVFNNFKDLLELCPSRDFKNCEKVVEKLSEPEDIGNDTATALKVFKYFEKVAEHFEKANEVVRSLKIISSTLGLKSKNRSKEKTFLKLKSSNDVKGLSKRSHDLELHDQHTNIEEIIQNINKNKIDALRFCSASSSRQCRRFIEKLSKQISNKDKQLLARKLDSLENSKQNNFGSKFCSPTDLSECKKSIKTNLNEKERKKNIKSSNHGEHKRAHELNFLPKTVNRRFLYIELDDHAIDVLKIAKLLKNAKDLKMLCPNDEYERCINLIRKLSNTKNIRRQVADVYNLIWILNHNHHVAEVCPITNLKKCIEFLESLERERDHESIIKTINEIYIKSTNNDYKEGKYLTVETNKDRKRHTRRNNGKRLGHRTNNGGHRVLQLVLVDTKNTFNYHEDDQTRTKHC